MSNFKTKYSLDCWFKTLEYLGFEIQYQLYFNSNDDFHDPKSPDSTTRIYKEKNKHKDKLIFLLQVRINYDEITKKIYSIYVERCKFIKDGSLWTEKISVDLKEFEKYFKEEFRNTNIELLIS